MTTQSMRATTAAESRYRIHQPNSRGRRVLVLALDAQGQDILGELLAEPWNQSLFGYLQDDRLQRISATGEAVAEATPLADSLDSIDAIVLVVTPDSPAAAFDLIGDLSQTRRIMTAGFVFGDTRERALHALLPTVRRITVSMVTHADRDALTESLHALRA